MVNVATLSIIWDSGASICITPDKTDFVGTLNLAGPLTYLQGVSKGLWIQGKGNVLWTILDIRGQLRTLKIPAYFVPQSQLRLLSTGVLLQTYSDEDIRVDVRKLTLSGAPNDPACGSIEAYLDPNNNLPMSTAYCQQGTDDTATIIQACLASISEANINLSEPQKELLWWHYCLGHVGFRQVQFLMLTGVLATSLSQRCLHTTAAHLPHPPCCAPCQYG
jgi:hypothetical protein